MALLKDLNELREEIISIYYGAALNELKDKIKEKPFDTLYYIYSGCVNKDIANEIANRFNNSGVKTRVCNYGFFTTKYYLEISLSLPDYFKDSNHENNSQESSGEEENQDESNNSEASNNSETESKNE